MADELDDVMDQYNIEGLDASMLEGAIQPPTTDNENGPPVQEDIIPVIPVPVKDSISDMAEQVNISAPDSSEVRKALTNPAANDKLVEVTRKDDSTLSILNTVMEEIAEEAAYLKAWRNTIWDGQKDISEATLSRIKMLGEFVKTLSAREKLKKEKAVGKVDFHSENFQNVLKYFMAVIMQTFKNVKIPQQYEDIFAAQLVKEFDGFEKKAEKIYYGKK